MVLNRLMRSALSHSEAKPMSIAEQPQGCKALMPYIYMYKHST